MPDDHQQSADDASPPKIKLNLAGAKPPSTEATVSIRPSAQKADTTRIELSQAQPPAAALGETQPVQADASTVKRSTIRIDVPHVIKSETQKVKAETRRVEPSSPHSTMRVEIAEPRKSETTRINIPEEAFQKAPGTVGLRPPAPEGAEDVFKRTTIPVGIPTPAPAPAARPKTITVKRPVAEAAPTAAEKAVSEAKKSETARIDLPADGGDRPATRPKTIRIKRPDGTSARKPLTISRPDAEPAAGTVPSGVIGGEEPAGAVYSALALVALLVGCVLVYVLAAQTFAPDLPWPGRI